jgi:hypothetical protein
VQNRLSRRIKKLENDLASQRTTNKVAQVALLGYIQRLVIVKGDPSPALLAKTNAKFIVTDLTDRHVVYARPGVIAPVPAPDYCSI